MKKSPHRLKHEQKKAIRTAQKENTYETESKEISEKQRKTYLSSPHSVKLSETKISSPHHHHKNSPDDITWQTEPESIHPEGKRWMQTVQKQTLNAASRLKKKLQKFSFKKQK